MSDQLVSLPQQLGPKAKSVLEGRTPNSRSMFSSTGLEALPDPLNVISDVSHDILTINGDLDR